MSIGNRAFGRPAVPQQAAPQQQNWGPGNPHYDYNAAGGQLSQVPQLAPGMVWVQDPDTGVYTAMDYGRSAGLGRDWMSDPVHFDAYMQQLLTGPFAQYAPLGYGPTAWLADWAAQQGWSADMPIDGLNHWQQELWLNLYDPWRQNYSAQRTDPGGGWAIQPVTPPPMPQAQAAPQPAAQAAGGQGLSAIASAVSPWLEGILNGSAPASPWRNNPFTF